MVKTGKRCTICKGKTIIGGKGDKRLQLVSIACLKPAFDSPMLRWITTNTGTVEPCV